MPPPNQRRSRAKDPAEAFGRLLQPFIGPFTRVAQRLEDGTIDLHQPATARMLLEREMDRVAVDAQALTAEDLAQAFASIPEDALTRPHRVRVKARSAVVVNYFRRVEEHVPLATLPLIGAFDFGSSALLDAGLGVAAHMRDAGRLRRERRSNALRQVATIGIEAVYFRLVDVIYFAECLVRDAHAAARRGGPRLRLVCGDWAPEALRGFLEADAHHIRNAAVHDGGWVYLPATDEISLTDRSWSRRFQNRDLYRLLRRMMADIETIFDTQRVIATPAILRLFHEAGMLRALRNQGGAQMDGRLLERALGPVFERAARVGVLPPPARQPQPDGANAAGVPG